MADRALRDWLAEDDCIWRGKQTFDFGGKAIAVDVFVRGEEITEKQNEAFSCFMEKWTLFQTELIEALIRYYNEKERFSHGPDNEKVKEEFWPEIETEESLLKTVALETIVVAEDFLMDEGRRIYLLFSKGWGGIDLDDNGIGVCGIDEKITEIGYKDIAF